MAIYNYSLAIFVHKYKKAFENGESSRDGCPKRIETRVVVLVDNIQGPCYIFFSETLLHLEKL